MPRVLSTTTPVARKTYECNACLWLQQALDGSTPADFGMTMADVRQIVRAKRDGWMILPGQTYIRSVQKYSSEPGVDVVRSRPEIDTICHKYDLYDVWWE